MTSAATSPAKPPLSPARRAGHLLFLSGQLPRQSDGTLVSGPIEAQTEQVIANVADLLAGHGLGLADVVKATVWLTDAAHAPGFNRVYAQRFSAPYPARSTVVSALIAPADIEMDVVALIPEPHDRPASAD
jgi:2-iminobutanoate/2-iminopropanoate deaminase